MSAEQKRVTVLEPLELRFLPDEGLELDEPLAAKWIDEQLADYATGAAAVHARAEGRARLDVQPLGAVATRPPIRVSGEIGAALRMTCVRCLQPVEQDVEAGVDLTLFPSDKARPAKSDAEDEGLTAAQLDEGSYDANAIDLPAIVREALILEIAMNPRCADEDACSGRTEALLREANREAEGMADDRWAALRRLRDAGEKPS